MSLLPAAAGLLRFGGISLPSSSVDEGEGSEDEKTFLAVLRRLLGRRISVSESSPQVDDGLGLRSNISFLF